MAHILVLVNISVPQRKTNFFLALSGLGNIPPEPLYKRPHDTQYPICQFHKYSDTISHIISE